MDSDAEELWRLRRKPSSSVENDPEELLRINARLRIHLELWIRKENEWKSERRSFENRLKERQRHVMEAVGVAALHEERRELKKENERLRVLFSETVKEKKPFGDAEEERNNQEIWELQAAKFRLEETISEKNREIEELKKKVQELEDRERAEEVGEPIFCLLEDDVTWEETSQETDFVAENAATEDHPEFALDLTKNGEEAHAAVDDLSDKAADTSLASTHRSEDTQMGDDEEELIEEEEENEDMVELECEEVESEESNNGSHWEEVADTVDEAENSEVWNIPRKRRGRRPTSDAVFRLLFCCPIENCPSSFFSFEELKKHAKSHSGKEKKSSCDVCKKEFLRVPEAMEHIQQREKRECCGCGKRCSSNQHLLQHHRVHTKEKPYSCDVCGKRFACQSNCNTHVRIHDEIKQFPCPFCERRFSQKPQLDNHRRVHTGEKQFECRFCKKRFILKSNLTYHERMHSGEKPFECEQCGQKFNRRSGYYIHMRRHTGERPYSCEKCDAKFAMKGTLENHMLTHTGEKPYSCQKCGGNFTKKYGLVRHISRKHPTIVEEL